MTEQFFDGMEPGVSIEMFRELAATEAAIESYARIALAKSTIDVTITDCRHPFTTLPFSLAEALTDMPKRPQAIESIDLKLNYDVANSRYTTGFAQLRFDNKYSLMFQRLRSPLKDIEGGVYYGALLDPVGAVAKRTDTTQLMPEDEVAKILETVGIGLPQSPQDASWEMIKKILRFAGSWTAATSYATQLDLARSVGVTDTASGSGYSANILQDDDGIQSRWTILSMDEAKDIMAPASKSYKVSAFSENRHDTPVIKQIQEIPLQYRLPMVEDYGVELLGEMPIVRHELSDKAVTLAISVPLLQETRKLIAEASRGEIGLD